jgi:signal transduction histidine kinase
MHDMIEGILLYSRAGRKSPKLEKVDTDSLVRDVIESLSPPGNICFRVGPGLPTVTMDPVQLGQIFQNLIGNAVKFIDKPAGTVEICCRSLEDYWEFHVKDNGPGIDGRHFERIFQIFHTLDDRGRRGGTGVGLTIVKKIVEMNGGTVHVESTVDKGSTFRFTLPKS